MEFDLGYGPQEYRAYVTPDVSTFYGEDAGSRHRTTPKHRGWAAKFVNVSARRVRVYWDPKNGRPGNPMSLMGPFESSGTASFPGHRFYVTDEDGGADGEVLASFEIDPPTSVYYYDGITVEGDAEATERNVARLSPEHQGYYRAIVDSRRFNEYYREFAGREETHFLEVPREEDLGKIDVVGSARKLKDGDARLLPEYRDRGQYLNMTLRVLSCSPRVFEVVDFLSRAEVDHIMYLTTGMTLHRSTTAGGSADASAGRKDSETRTSLNTWVYRENDAVIDTVYRRAADLLRIDEAMLRPRSADEFPDMDNTRSMAEALQLVHYDVGQEYTAHHDFGYSRIHNKDQPARFATLLLYLNEGMEGGATQFPRWINAETSEALSVEPEVGKAVLFYSQLPDGNMDDFSHHAAMPVRKGEKWLMNLWVWDPKYG
ncbi:hypothetical protein ACHAW5_010387 [Stephanodiscus triporus]|uniref:Fe2OG dioxygenase domain-containing protein n=1 Tax=Stephanodiscus triporus TaxID=2934178 RepID=A0ABD3QG43_9STRA